MGVEVTVKREDLIHPEFGGNKWHKLKYNLRQAAKEKQDTLLTFGGAWSNHIYATSALGKKSGFKTIGIIRGEPGVKLTSTLQFATAHGMKLRFIDRNSYRQKQSTDFIECLTKEFGQFYLLPEGGSNQLALRGCAEIVAGISEPYDVITVACGTGATLAGLILGASNQARCIGFSVLKGANFLQSNVINMLKNAGRSDLVKWDIDINYHCNGYAKTTPELWVFMNQFYLDTGIPLDAVYTAKHFYGLFKKIESGHFSRGTKILAIHTGGLQGNLGFKEYLKKPSDYASTAKSYSISN